MRYLMTVLCGLMVSTSAAAHDDNDFDWLLIPTDYEPSGIIWDVAQPSLDRAEQINLDLEARLQILRDTHDINLRHQLQQVPVAFQLNGETIYRGLIAVFFQNLGDQPVWVMSEIFRPAGELWERPRTFTYRFREMTTITDPNIGMSEPIMNITHETRTMVSRTLKEATFLTHEHCVDMRPVAEASVAQDPSKIVIWSSCQHPNEGLGYVLKVHHLLVDHE